MPPEFRACHRHSGYCECVRQNTRSGPVYRRVLFLQIVLAAACASHREPGATLSPQPTPVELGLAAEALEDPSVGPSFPPDRLNLAVALLRWIYGEVLS